ncbi:MAG: ATP-grasp domain-containing protein [Planctomycetaceae bacterium]|nr:ATP-grasp domain-containing protein [Planctomycetaceae bacterium]
MTTRVEHAICHGLNISTFIRGGGLQYADRHFFMSRPPVIICGASVRSLAASAIQCGWAPICFDFFADTDLIQLLQRSGGKFAGQLRSFRDLPSILDAISGEVPLVWCGGMENYPSTLAELALMRPVIGPTVDSVMAVRNTESLRGTLNDCGVYLPENAPDTGGDQEQRWLIKPIHSSGGQHIRLLDSAGDLAAVSPDFQYQRFIDGCPISATFVATAASTRLIGCSLILSGVQSLNASGFQFCGNIGPVVLPQLLQDRLIRAAQAVTSRTQLRGAFGVDMILKEGELWLLEINPRITASHEIYELSSNRNLFAEHVAAVSNTDPNAHLRSPAVTHMPDQWSTVLRLIVYSRSEEALDAGSHFSSLNSTGETFHETGRYWLADLPGEQVKPQISSPSSPAIPVPCCSVYVAIRRGLKKADSTPSVFLENDVRTACRLLQSGRPLNKITKLGGQVSPLVDWRRFEQELKSAMQQFRLHVHSK